MDYYINWGLCNLPTLKLPDKDVTKLEKKLHIFVFV